MFNVEEAPEPCLVVGAIGSRSNNLRHERQRTPFFVSGYLLVAGPHEAGQEGVAKYMDVLVQAKRQDITV